MTMTLSVFSLGAVIQYNSALRFSLSHSIGYKNSKFLKWKAAKLKGRKEKLSMIAHGKSIRHSRRQGFSFTQPKEKVAQNVIS